ncbi:alpha/beta hydrolase fold-domain-containing protein [Cokeromyces recurvatus]|uniref:alpha/beta hydrolase fold-domain-containing protein n=1 Tax=Cokeromyces recurvatus TaxID=90255 RepID=UPI00221EA256|nr:alpha/beta hydrolase fold-domain-containing protein [Cokeromyces recurvatus]KAI7900952.1 alpha/beta hydrolase fold-domain-containing protein [Cokeromyces recurvatus]
MPKYKPYPIPLAIISQIKSVYNIDSDEEACQPAIIREFYDTLYANQLEGIKEVKKEDREITFNGIKVNISILRPSNTPLNEVLPVMLFLHGGGWIVGSYDTHRILTNELVNLIPACIIFVHFSYSPEVKHPVALEECYAALCWVHQHAQSIYVNPTRLVIAGDSAGGNLCAGLAILAKERQKIHLISYQLLFYPVLDVDFDTKSYIENKDNSVLSRDSMKYVWDAYLTSHQGCYQKEVTAVPMSASLDVLKGLPPVLMIIAEKDVLRTEGELYSKKLMKAGVNVVCTIYLGTHHGFLTLPQMSKPQSEAALEQIIGILRKHWNSQSNKL